MGGANIRKPYPKGQKKQLTPEWKVLVRERLSSLGHDHRWLEAQLGVGRGMVTRMLSDEQNTSALVDQVCAALAIPPPLAVAGTAEEIRMVEGYRRMSPDQRRHLLGLLGVLDREPPS